MTKESSSLDFVPAPGIIIVDPIKKTKKSDYMAVADSVDDPHRGHVVAIGDSKPYEHDPKLSMSAPVKAGDSVLYSIVGCERTRLEYEGDFRHEFVVVPFNRILGIIKK